ncbi:murein L,D-transpeptidase catalytic domain family protein [Marinobacter sp.]|uniref:murein L,D-transpeptidase catalytic domain family protein n=1 Tax=Marinobacter sp. TaxID=50741 RepID=UPI00384DC280
MILRHLPSRFSVLFLALFPLILSSPPSLGGGFDEQLVVQLARSAPNLDPGVLRSAVRASRCAVSTGVEAPERLAVIDFSLPSSEERMWIFDLSEQKLMFRELVAHGKNSGMTTATDFSNVLNSYQSSIGLFRASESYFGKHGYSLRLDGLETGINDRARERAIVIHGADYVDPSWVSAHGRIGRSHGCPAVRQGVIKNVVDNLKGGQLVFKYYPDQKWLQSSRFLNCDEGKILSSAGASEAGSRRVL